MDIRQDFRSKLLEEKKEILQRMIAPHLGKPLFDKIQQFINQPDVTAEKLDELFGLILDAVKRKQEKKMTNYEQQQLQYTHLKQHINQLELEEAEQEDIEALLDSI